MDMREMFTIERCIRDSNEDGSIGALADVLWQSTVWYFWWD